MTNSASSSELQTSAERQAVERLIARLKVVNVLRYLALPAAAIGAGVSAAAAPIAFPIAAGVAVVVLGIGEFVARRERKELDEHLQALG